MSRVVKVALAVGMVCSAQAFAPSMHGFVHSPALSGVRGRSISLASSPMVAKARKELSLSMSTPTPPAAAPTPNFLPPPALYKAMANSGGAKAGLSWWKTLYLGILAGVYIGFGSCLSLAVGGACGGLAAAGNLGLQKIVQGAFGLPFGLLMVTIGGAELFTGNTAALSAGLSEGKADGAAIAKNWFWSYLGNLIGSVALALIVFHSGALTAPSIATAKTMAGVKTGLTFSAAFLRGLLCNWLVCMAVWQATAAQDVGSKAIAIWFPISAFIAMGFEHSVANMFFLPLGIMLGADVTWKSVFLSNLLPVTLGNAFAGFFLVAGSYALMYGTPGDKLSRK